MNIVTLAVAALGLGVCGVPDAGADGPERLRLENGVTVILQPVAGTGWVGMETFYRVGFIDEPEGLTQAAHLVEHLVCNAATAGYAPGASMERLNERGLANAETLAGFTHYDSMVPADMLDEALKIESERLTGLKIDAPIIAQEAPRCYSEAAGVEGTAQAPMFKFALMAANQSWRFGAERALVKGGLVEAPIDAIRAFHAAHYTPANLTVVLAGDFEKAGAERLVREHLGAIPSPAKLARAPIDWTKTPRDSVVQWDSTARGLLLAWAPPEGADERLALSLWATLATERLNADAEVLKDATFVLGSMHIYPVGDLPLFVYATVRPEAGDGAAKRIEARAREVLTRRPTDADLVQVRMLLDQMVSPPALTREMVVQRAASLARTLQRDEGRAAGMMLGNAALQIGLGEMVLGGDTETAARVRAMGADELAAISARVMDPGRTVVTRLEPMGKE
jgi:predicted Zn-dependent peptidase